MKAKGKFTDSPKELFTLTFEGYKNILCLLLNSDQESLLSKIQNKKNDIFWGSEVKKNQLSLLTQFFINCLNCLYRLIQDEKISDDNIRKVEECFDELIADRNAYKLLKIIDQYTLMEKNRWKVIGSKD